MVMVVLVMAHFTHHAIPAARGYLVSEANLTIDEATFRERFPDLETIRKDMDIVVTHSKNRADKIFVFFPESDASSKSGAVSVKHIRPYLDRMETENIRRCILVVSKGFTSFAKQTLAEMSAFKVEHFNDSELLVNITKHVLVPEHEVLSEEDKQAVLDRYRLKESQLPRMLFTDPVARFYGLRRGQVVKIKRKSETAGRYITYRYVI